MPTLDAQIKNQIHVSAWIQENLAIQYSFDGESGRWAFSCFDLAIEHHSAILRLITSKLYGSAFALIRVEYEAFIRGLWLRYAASDKEVKKFKRDKAKLQFGDLVTAVELARGIESGILSYIKNQQWSIFNSFTHTGIEALLRRIGAKTTGFDNYCDEDVVSCLKFSGFIALLTAAELALLTKDEKLIERTVKVLHEYRDK